MLVNVLNLEKRHQISRVHLIRETIEMSVLHSLSQVPWSKHVAFYGGTALRLAYDSPRFSEDIDLFMLNQFDYKLFESWVRKLGSFPDFKVSVEDIHCKRKTYFSLLMIQHPEIKHALPLKIELYRNINSKLDLRTELRLLKSPLSPLSPLIQISPLEVILQMKIEALADRAKPRDFYDLWYIAQLLRQPFSIPDKLPQYQKRFFENELKVYLPRDHHSIIPQLWNTYEQSVEKNAKSS
jgi:predicted nucleotidyltransferase component of viral defense system